MKKTETPGCLELLWVLCVIFVVAPVVWAVCTVPIWRWFVAAVFHVPTPSVAQMIGIAYLVSMFSRAPSTSGSKEFPDGWRVKLYTHSFVVPLFALGAAWLVHHFG